MMMMKTLCVGCDAAMMAIASVLAPMLQLPFHYCLPLNQCAVAFVDRISILMRLIILTAILPRAPFLMQPVRGVSMVHVFIIITIFSYRIC